MNKWHARWYAFLRVVLAVPVSKKLHCRCGSKDLPDGANLIIANHVTKNDFILISAYYRQYIKYVVGENVFRKPVAKKLIDTFLGVIVHLRGVSSLNTLKQMSKCLSSGENVCIFPEGTMTFDGKTNVFDASILKFAKRSGANLVLLKLSGAYFTQPRWGISIRPGKIEISDYVITADELSKMSVSDIQKLVEEKVYVDDQEEQDKSPVKFIGKNMCKGLESCIYECPECKNIGGLTSSGTHLSCRCGFSARYDEYGKLNYNGKTYTISHLCNSQKKSIKDRIKEADSAGKSLLLFSDVFELKRLVLNESPINIGKTEVNVYNDKIEAVINGELRTFDFEDISDVFIILRNTIDFVLKESKQEYELCGDFSVNALKYRDLFNLKKEIS